MIEKYRSLYRGDYMLKNWAWRASGIDDLIAGSTSFIEVGAGRGQLARKMRKDGLDWTACDPAPSTDDIELGALPSLKYADRSFDCSVAVDVLEHISHNDIMHCIAELRRVARRGAWAVANMSDVHKVDGSPIDLHLIQKHSGWWVEQVRSIGGVCTVHKTDCSARFWLEVSW